METNTTSQDKGMIAQELLAHSLLSGNQTRYSPARAQTLLSN